eukprot:468389-Pleurochrysis_carterae.AAC.1
MIRLSSSGSSCACIRWARWTPGVSYSCDPPENASIATAASVVPGVSDEIGRRFGRPPYEESRKAAMKADLPTFAAPRMNTSRPARSLRIAVEAPMMPSAVLDEQTRTSSTPPRRDKASCGVQIKG